MRSFLFVPGNNPSMLQNSFVFESDMIIIDLEDAVSIDEKDSARNLVNTYLNTNVDLSKIIVRVNGMDTSFFSDDMDMLSNHKIAGVMLPKVNVEVLNNFTKAYSSDLYPIVESCEAVLQIPEIVKNLLVKGVLLGAEDLSSDLEVQRTKNSMEILYPRQVLAYSAKAYGKLAIDTPNTSTNDEKLLIEDCKFAKSIGFKAKSCIHPNQVHIVNKVFSVTQQEYLWGLRVLKTTEANVGKGAFSLDGQMIDEPVIQRAKRIVKEGESIYGK